jgi:hypothetical protein
MLLECRMVDGWCYPDIEVHLGIPDDVLVRRVHRLRTDLRRKAKALGAGDGGAACDDEGVVGVERGGPGDADRQRAVPVSPAEQCPDAVLS